MNGWMNDAHVYEMQVQMWKPNTWGVTAVVMLIMGKSEPFLKFFCSCSFALGEIYVVHVLLTYCSLMDLE